MPQSSTLFTVGTLLRHAQDAATPVRVLVSGVWLDGVIVGADGLGVILDDGNSHQVLVRLDSIVAVSFSRAAIDGDEEPDDADDAARAHWGAERTPIEAGPVSRPH
ncbi:hypothetical protein SAMN04489844_3456 [Nocardioides exalbidus]|uniref:Uncharacterized protein n=1 Tax=Nocardioides exalbidus TaxID=402596 RepID=A0A1H4X507_9ACTN|nr:hypothetical protein [Nocardioides exalbidus]SED00756.1 hypothetical protein SAMN04489844_3456 [Nocardioides exalbidus]